MKLHVKDRIFLYSKCCEYAERQHVPDLAGDAYLKAIYYLKTVKVRRSRFGALCSAAYTRVKNSKREFFETASARMIARALPIEDAYNIGDGNRQSIIIDSLDDPQIPFWVSKVRREIKRMTGIEQIAARAFQWEMSKTRVFMQLGVSEWLFREILRNLRRRFVRINIERKRFEAAVSATRD